MHRSGDGGLAMRRAVWIILLLVFVTACQAPKADPKAEATARAIYDDLRLGQDESLQGLLPPRLRNASALAGILRLRQAIPTEAPKSSKVVAWQRAEAAGGVPVESIAIEYDYPGKATLLGVVLVQPPGGGAWEVTTLQIHGATDAELNRNGLNMSGKSPIQLGFLAYAIAAPLLMVFAMIKVAATPNLRFKWLWVVVSFIGIFSLHMNWTSGTLTIDWLSVQVVGAYASSSISRFDPWTIDATLPIGALLILGGLWANPQRAKRPPQVQG